MKTLPIAGSWHSGWWQDHNGWVLGLLQRHLRLHRPGRLLWPHGQERLETLSCWILLLPRYSCLWNHAKKLLLSVTLVSWCFFVKSVAHQWIPPKNNVNVYYAIIECISEYDNYTWELEYINIWLLTCYPISGNLPAIGIIMNNFRTLYIIPIELSFTSPNMCNISNIKAGLLFSSVKASNYDAAFESVDMNYDESAWIHLWFIVLNDPPRPNPRKVLVEAGFTISESTSNIWCYASFMIWYTFLEIESRIAKTNFTLGPIEKSCFLLQLKWFTFSINWPFKRGCRWLPKLF